MACHLCNTTPVPDNYGSPRKCHFDDNGVFTPEGWNCVTANAIRELMDGGYETWNPDAYRTRTDDESIGVLWLQMESDGNGNSIGHCFIVATWYKERGRTSRMYRMVDGEPPSPLTLKEAEYALRLYSTSSLSSGRSVGQNST